MLNWLVEVRLHLFHIIHKLSPRNTIGYSPPILFKVEKSIRPVDNPEKNTNQTIMQLHQLLLNDKCN